MEIDKKVSLLLSLCSKFKKIATFIRKRLNWIGAWIGGGIYIEVDYSTRGNHIIIIIIVTYMRRIPFLL